MKITKLIKVMEKLSNSLNASNLQFIPIDVFEENFMNNIWEIFYPSDYLHFQHEEMMQGWL